MTSERAPFFSIDGPLFVPPPFGAIRAGHYLRGFKKLVTNLGGDCRNILEQLDIDPVAADDPDYPLNCIAGASILEYCSKRFNDNLFGMRLAEYQDADVYGCLTMLARTAPDLRTAVEALVEYVPVLHSPGAPVEFVTANQTAEFRWLPYGDIGSDEQSISHGLLLLVKLFETLEGGEFRPTYITAVTDISRRNLSYMEDRFHCKVTPKASANAIGFHTSHLDRPLKTSNRMLFGLLRSYLSRVDHGTEPALADRVEVYVRNELSSGACSLERCAAKFGTTVRTLHRHLTQKGLKFSDVVEKQRCIIARRALWDTDLTLVEIACSLGYSEQSSFGRAFKRWMDVTPQAYRDSKPGRSDRPN